MESNIFFIILEFYCFLAPLVSLCLSIFVSINHSDYGLLIQIQNATSFKFRTREGELAALSYYIKPRFTLGLKIRTFMPHLQNFNLFLPITASQKLNIIDGVCANYFTFWRSVLFKNSIVRNFFVFYLKNCQCIFHDKCIIKLNRCIEMFNYRCLKCK